MAASDQEKAGRQPQQQSGFGDVNDRLLKAVEIVLGPGTDQEFAEGKSVQVGGRVPVPRPAQAGKRKLPAAGRVVAGRAPGSEPVLILGRAGEGIERPVILAFGIGVDRGDAVEVGGDRVRAGEGVGGAGPGGCRMAEDVGTERRPRHIPRLDPQRQDLVARGVRHAQGFEHGIGHCLVVIRRQVVVAEIVLEIPLHGRPQIGLVIARGVDDIALEVSGAVVRRRVAGEGDEVDGVNGLGASRAVVNGQLPQIPGADHPQVTEHRVGLLRGPGRLGGQNAGGIGIDGQGGAQPEDPKSRSEQNEIADRWRHGEFSLVV